MPGNHAMRFSIYTLQSRFLAGLVGIMLVMGLFFGLLLHIHLNDLLLSEARSKAQLVGDTVNAVEEYVREVQRPSVAMAVQPDDFVIEAMSTSYILRHVLNAVTVKDNDFTFRRVARGARNPDFEAKGEEAVLYDRFRNDPTLKSVEQVETGPNGKRLILANPIRFTDDCMRCHTTPARAPSKLVHMYGALRGFNRKSGELAGINVLSVAVGARTAPIVDSVVAFAVWFGSGMLLLLVGVQFFFSRLVAHNLRRVGAIIQRNFFPAGDDSLIGPLGREEEIEGMIRSIETVAEHLGDARRRLGEYAEQLESMVAARTDELQGVVRERNTDVELFVGLLSGFGPEKSKAELLVSSLELIAGRFNASGAAYADAADKACAAWTAAGLGGERVSLCGSIRLYLSAEVPLLLDDRWVIPVRTSGGVHGVLGLFWNAQAAPPTPERLFLAEAFARQLGIVAENLDALDVVLNRNALLASVVEGISDPLILVESDGSPVLANTSARKLGSRLAGEAGEQEDPDGLRTLVTLAGDLAGFGAREISRPDGSSFAVTLYPVHDFPAHAGRVVVHIRETTNERQMLEHLRRSDKLAAVGSLAAGLAHEINNPLGVIRCYAELLAESAVDERSRADVEVIVRHVEQAQSVLRDLLDFSRPSKPLGGCCDVTQLLGSLPDLFRVQARAAGVAFEVHAAQGLPRAAADRGMLEQVLVNLLLNALDALRGVGADDGRIVLSADTDAEGGLRIVVADNGSGIDPAQLDKIFDPFFTTKAPGTGTGLGLAVAYGLLRDMGGRLEVGTAEPGWPGRRGAVFTITLAAAEKEAADEPF